jgi:hypothetical protein
MRQPANLRYEKDSPVPGWDKSLWPKKDHWRISARLERWRILVASAAVAALVMAGGAWLFAAALASMGEIALPEELMPFGPTSNPYRLALAGGVFALTGTIWLALALRLITAKLWYAVRSVQFSPDPHYGPIDFRSPAQRRRARGDSPE